MTSRIRAIHLGVLALLVALVGATGTAQQSAPPGRLTVAVLWFADKTGEQQLSHWRCAVRGLLNQQLREAKAVRVLPAGAVDYAFRQLAVKKGSSLDAGQILKGLGVKPSESERQKMSQQWRTSPAALEAYSRAIALQDDEKPFTEQEEHFRKAPAADPQFTKAHVGLAGTLGSQGKFTEAEQAIRRALELEPDCADAHLILGTLSLFLKKPAEAEQELRKAHNLDPDDSLILSAVPDVLYSTSL